MSISNPPQGTHFSDGLRTGPILGTIQVPGANVLSPSTMISTPADQQPPGIFNAPISAYTIIPSAVDFDRLFDEAVALPGYLQLKTSPEHGISIITYNSIPNVIKLDVPRNITIDGLTDDVEQSQFDVYGWDIYGIPMVERISGPDGQQTVEGRKAFAYIRTIYSSADTVDPIAIGVGNKFGMPYLIPNRQAILSILWENQIDAGMFIPGDQSPATAITGDVRGTYTPSTGANNVNMLSVYFYNWSGDAQNYNLANTGTESLASEPLSSTNGQSVIQVLSPNHQLTIGQPITISGATGFANISAAQLNLSTTVSRILDADRFEYISNGIANATDTSGGGDDVYLTPAQGNLYTTPSGRFGVPQYSVDPV